MAETLYNVEIDWASPLESEQFVEYRDREFLRAVGLGHLADTSARARIKEGKSTVNESKVQQQSPGEQHPPSMHRPVAYFTQLYPGLTQTFIYREVQALRDRFRAKPSA